MTWKVYSLVRPRPLRVLSVHALKLGEPPYIGNVVEYDELVFLSGLPESASELLKKDPPRMRYAIEHHQLDVGHVDPFVEHIDDGYDPDLTVSKSLQHARTFVFRELAMQFRGGNAGGV